MGGRLATKGRAEGYDAVWQIVTRIKYALTLKSSIKKPHANETKGFPVHTTPHHGSEITTMQDDDTLNFPEGSTKRQRKAAPPAVTTPPRHFDVATRDYDVELIERFLDRVFHVELNENEEVLTWAVPRHCKPVYPIPEGELLDMLETSKIGRALYIGTATAHRDHIGHLYNRQALFERLHVIVLDDIGTKAPAEGLPPAMQNPSYIIETSAGNFQYGYVLAEPIESLDAAKALVMLMYEAGIADAGGKMPNKLVRLPEGINGKKGEDKCDFVSKLHTMAGPDWTPQQLLDALDVGEKWENVTADAAEATKRRARIKGGSTPWAPYTPARASMSGIIDPIAEWLETNEHIVSEAGDWLTIRCPFKHNHTSGGDTAGYKPLGVGEDPACRAFHCFHDGCHDMKTREFLQYVSLLDGPNVAVRDDVAELVSSYVYDMYSDVAWRIKHFSNPTPITMSGMRNAYPRSTIVYTAEGKPKSVSEFSRWLTSESRVVVMGPTFDPSNPSRLIERSGELYVNQYCPPPWRVIDYDKKQVAKFKEFLEFLIPDGYEREYFYDWLAAKVQDMGFRGIALVMVAQNQGVGRGTLMEFVTTLLGGSVNVRNEPFSKVVSEDPYNEWMEAPLIISNETLNSGGLNTYKSYEKLKDMIDPMPITVTINPKYGKQRRSRLHSSFIFLSNHSNALSLPADDRRFFVISNPDVPAAPAYYAKLQEWLKSQDHKGDPVWVNHLYSWLMKRNVNMEKLLAPPKSTAGKEAMMLESRSEIETVATEVLHEWPSEYITQQQFTHALEMFADRVGLYDIPNYKLQIKRIYSSRTYPMERDAVMKLNGKPCRPRIIVNRAGPDSVKKGQTPTKTQRKGIVAGLIEENIKAALARAAEGIDAAGL